MADQLSPANQVMIAVAYVYQEHGGEPPARAVAAAALRAAAAIETHDPWGGRIESAGSMWMRDQILAIATELENHQ